MPILAPDGKPVQKPGEVDPNRPFGMGGSLLGWAILRKDAHGGMVPLGDPKTGNILFIPNKEDAIKQAGHIADQELRPNADQKVVTPLQQSAQYLVVQVNVLGVIQAKINNPDQLLAPQGVKPN